MFAGLTAISLLLTSWLPFVTPPHPPVPRTLSVCTAPASGDVACLAKVLGDASGKVVPAAKFVKLPVGYGPAQLRSAYAVPAGTGGRVAVIGAYDNPSAKADLDTYSTNFGLPKLPSCTNATQGGCFAKYDQRGGTIYPFRDRGWALETSLDVQTVHAVCPTCRIDLVEASSASIANLMTAVDRAVTLGSKVVSMSWGAGEFSSQTSYDSHFAPSGVSFVGASGDWGYGPIWPAASGQVVAVGGTSLALDSSGARLNETAWSDGGPGCSAYAAKPVCQHDTGCTRRTSSDVAAVADPATGAAIYSSFSPYGTGWFQLGGTSLSTPLVAGLIAQTSSLAHAAVFAKIYGAAGTPDLFDVVSGSNGSCIVSYLCAAGIGYDGPTGLGSPNGLGAL